LKVSVVIPNYNYGRFVEQAINSVLNQTHPPHEVVVVDNGSTDDSRIRLAAIQDPRVIKIFQENKGQSMARNVGLEICTGEIVGFLDADDVWLPEKLEKQVQLFSDPAIGLVYCGIKRVNGSLEDIGVTPDLPKYRGDILDHFATETSSVVCGGESTALVRRDLFRRTGPFDPRLSIGTGWDMWRRLAAISRIDFVSEVLVLYRQHGSNLSRRLDVYTNDTELKLAKFFSDPESKRSHSLKALAMGRHRMSLAGAYWQQNEVREAIRWGAKAALSHPLALRAALAWPLRRLQRIYRAGSSHG
jgi:glycosyltransferase involved in cell wall biosynthesis